MVNYIIEHIEYSEDRYAECSSIEEIMEIAKECGDIDKYSECCEWLGSQVANR
jgi:hypothetical protein